MTEPSATFLLFGATGDLARRMIFPSLYNLLADGLLPDDFLIVASGRTEMEDEPFREEVCAALQQFLPADRYDADVAARFRAMICYQPVDAGNPDQFAALAQRIDGRLERGLSVYLSTPPSLFALPAMGLAQIAPPDGAFYIYADISHLTNDSLSFCQRLLRETGVASAPGVDFDPVDGHRFIRFSFAVSTDRIEDAIARMTPWFQDQVSR